MFNLFTVLSLDMIHLRSSVNRGFLKSLSVPPVKSMYNIDPKLVDHDVIELINRVYNSTAWHIINIDVHFKIYFSIKTHRIKTHSPSCFTFRQLRRRNGCLGRGEPRNVI